MISNTFMSKKVVAFCSIFLSCLLLPCVSNSQEPALATEKNFVGKKYKLSFHDEFNGTSLDSSKWYHRSLGINKHHLWSFFTKDATWVDGKGKLIMSVYTLPRTSLPKEIADQFRAHWVPLSSKWIPHSSMIRTHKEFTFGYHEVRLMMPIAKGAGMAVWMQSKFNRQPNKTSSKLGAEIDIIEQSFYDKYGNPNDYKHSTIHWGGYGGTHQWISINVLPGNKKYKQDAAQDAGLNLTNKKKNEKGMIHKKINYYSDNLNFRDEKFHTVGVLWTPKFYKFYYDGELIGTIKDDVANAPAYMILSPRLFNFARLMSNTEKGMGSRDTTKTKYIIDYYRVYMPK